MLCPHKSSTLTGGITLGVTAEPKEDGFTLGRWVSKQRTNKESIYSDQLDRLEALGFVWDAREAAREEAVEVLRQFHAREGHSKVPAAYEVDGFRLGTWVSNRRKEQDSLSPERIKRLEALGFVWDIRKPGN
jgi:hypothetical protein